MTKVSVIIPAYNAMAYLPEAVESVLGQTFTDFELLIINDGSSDQTMEWVSQLVDPRVELISQKNQGVSEARNTGIAHAQGEYVAFLDADDLWEPTKLEKQVRCLEDNPAVGLVDTGVALIDEQGKLSDKVMTSQAEGDVWKQILECNTLFCASTPMVRRCCFKAVGGFNRNLSSVADWDMWIRVASRYSFTVVKEALVRYRQHSSNMSKNCQFLLPEFRIVIEKAFESVPPELLYLKSRAYGRANLYIAWKSLEVGDYKGAVHFRQQALAHYPQLCFSESFIHLRLIITAKRWLGDQGYSRVRALINALPKLHNLSKQRISSRQPLLEDN